jgi:hypothetical protein
MPALIHESPGMALRGLALIDQQVQEQTNGLVVVSLKFTAPAARETQVRRLFFFDAPPPIKPSAVNFDLLQNGKIFMSDASFEVAQGLLHISATYYGAAYAAQRTPFVTRSYESRVTTIRIVTGSIRTNTVITDGQLTSSSERTVADIYTIRYKVEKPSIEFAAIDALAIDAKFLLPAASIVKAQIIRADLNTPDFSLGVSRLQHRSLSPLRLLQDYTRINYLDAEKSIDNKTRRVVVEKYTADLSIEDAR